MHWSLDEPHLHGLRDSDQGGLPALLQRTHDQIGRFALTKGVYDNLQRQLGADTFPLAAMNGRGCGGGTSSIIQLPRRVCVEPATPSPVDPEAGTSCRMPLDDWYDWTQLKLPDAVALFGRLAQSKRVLVRGKVAPASNAVFRTASERWIDEDE